MFRGGKRGTGAQVATSPLFLPGLTSSSLRVPRAARAVHPFGGRSREQMSARLNGYDPSVGEQQCPMAGGATLHNGKTSLLLLGAESAAISLKDPESQTAGVFPQSPARTGTPPARPCRLALKEGTEPVAHLGRRKCALSEGGLFPHRSHKRRGGGKRGCCSLALSCALLASILNSFSSV